MIAKAASFTVLTVCVWGVLNPKLKTRTVGTLGLSLIGLLALVNIA